MEIHEFESELKRRHPDWNVHKKKYGIATWLDVRTSRDRGYVLEVVPGEGVGVSPLPLECNMDFGGHSDVFDDLGEALEHIDAAFNRRQ